MSAARTRRLLLIVAAPALLAGPGRAAEVWTVETVGSGVIDVSLALDASGAARIAFSSRGQPAYAEHDGSAWTTDYLVPPPTPPPAGLGIAGTEIVFYVWPSLGFDPASNEPRIAYTRAENGQLWFTEHSPSGWSYQFLSYSAGPPSLVIDAAGIPHIAYSHYATGTVYAVRNGNTWSQEPIGVAGYPSSLCLDGSGNPRLALSSSSPNSDMLYAERGAGGWSSVAVDTAGNTGLYASLALDPWGESHLSYHDRTTHALRYAARSGGTWTVETVVSPVGDGCDNSLVMGPDGEPYIAFRESDSGELRFARRSGGGWSSELVVAGSGVGLGCSLALDSQGRPHIAYYDGSTGIGYATRSSVVFTGVGPAPAVHGWGIERLAPNPARPGEALELSLRMAEARSVELELLDATGRRVASRSVSGVGAGLQTLRWDPAVRRAGLYFLRARFGANESAVTRLAILR